MAASVLLVELLTLLLLMLGSGVMTGDDDDSPMEFWPAGDKFEVVERYSTVSFKNDMAEKNSHLFFFFLPWLPLGICASYSLLSLTSSVKRSVNLKDDYFKKVVLQWAEEVDLEVCGSNAIQTRKLRNMFIPTMMRKLECGQSPSGSEDEASESDNRSVTHIEKTRMSRLWKENGTVGNSTFQFREKRIRHNSFVLLPGQSYAIGDAFTDRLECFLPRNLERSFVCSSSGAKREYFTKKGKSGTIVQAE
ncbi:hypothetical protein FQR65_LT19918 [Abscondita terminalis]|nr:hypothetical protein FQR65_LT19918 [Abscondita terminalis]